MRREGEAGEYSSVINLPPDKSEVFEDELMPILRGKGNSKQITYIVRTPYEKGARLIDRQGRYIELGAQIIWVTLTTPAQQGKLPTIDVYGAYPLPRCITKFTYLKLPDGTYNFFLSLDPVPSVTDELEVFKLITIAALCIKKGNIKPLKK